MWLRVCLRDENNAVRHSRVTPWKEFEAVLEEVASDCGESEVLQNDHLGYRAAFIEEGIVLGYCTAEFISEEQFNKEQLELQQQNEWAAAMEKMYPREPDACNY